MTKEKYEFCMPALFMIPVLLRCEALLLSEEFPEVSKYRSDLVIRVMLHLKIKALSPFET
jgi:hypothetical protein